MPASMNIGTNTMQIAERRDERRQRDLHARRRGWRTRRPALLQMPVDVLDVTVASSTRMPTASASPPRVMMLMVSPRATGR